jgi:SHS2 domain-containing protein
LGTVLSAGQEPARHGISAHPLSYGGKRIGMSDLPSSMMSIPNPAKRNVMMSSETSHAKPGIDTPRWELFPHVADMGVRGYGRTIEEAFAHAAEALTAVICDPAEVRVTTPVEIRCEAPDVESLLVDWLNALVYEMAVRQMVFGRFEVRIDIHIDSSDLQATVWGETVERERHYPAVEVKGATYTELKVDRDENGGAWIAQCVVDV